MLIYTPIIAARLGPHRRQKRLTSGEESSGGKYGFDDADMNQRRGSSIKLAKSAGAQHIFW